MLTGSASKGRTQRYYYYHCSSACGVRHKASDANEKIVEEIKKYVNPLPKLQLYKEVITSVFKSKTGLQRQEMQQLKVQLEEANRRLAKARDLLLAGDIQADDYRIIKSDSEEKINRLEVKLISATRITIDVEPLLTKAISNISQLDILYEEGSVTQQRKIIGSMFPENLTFDRFEYRTTRINEAINLISLIDKKIGGKKNGTNPNISDLSQEVNWLGLEPRTHTLKVYCSTN